MTVQFIITTLHNPGTPRDCCFRGTDICGACARCASSDSCAATHARSIFHVENAITHTGLEQPNFLNLSSDTIFHMEKGIPCLGRNLPDRPSPTDLPFSTWKMASGVSEHKTSCFAKWPFAIFHVENCILCLCRNLLSDLQFSTWKTASKFFDLYLNNHDQIDCEETPRLTPRIGMLFSTWKIALSFGRWREMR